MASNDFYLSLPFRLKAQVTFRGKSQHITDRYDMYDDAMTFIRHRDEQASRSAEVIRIREPLHKILVPFDKLLQSCVVPSEWDGRNRLAAVVAHAPALFEDPRLYFVFERGRKLKQVEIVLYFANTNTHPEADFGFIADCKLGVWPTSVGARSVDVVDPYTDKPIV